ncbi:MAG TPA: amylo-alpha-1,6-glucosidase [Lacipirellulaceae bacterium]|jgi:predicted glycogen debranching enzyme
MGSKFSSTAEWLEADGLGGFASGTVCGRRTRRYHALLLAATTPPTGRVVLVNGIEAWIEASGDICPISSQLYAPHVIHPDGDRRIESFEREPWPRWVFRLESGHRIEQEIFVPHERAAVAIRWRLLDQPESETLYAADAVWLTVRPLVSGRDYHSMHHENQAFRFAAETNGQCVTWQPYDGVPGVRVLSNATYRETPIWYRNFFYEREAERGLDATEDLASPGEFRWNLTAGDAVWLASAVGLPKSLAEIGADALTTFQSLRLREAGRRAAFAAPIERAADAYIVLRGEGRTIVAGYPWFTDWGRDTFIAIRGLCIATGRLDVAREILLAWAGVVSEGMLPNRFPDSGGTPEFNSVDASLWYVVAVHEYLSANTASDAAVEAGDRQALLSAVRAILEGYIRGTRYRIHVEADGLLAAGEQGVQLTWMDVKIGDWVVTPRIGKPVELQALWLNALWIAERWMVDAGEWGSLREGGQDSFARRFWNAERGCLFDVVDVNHEPGGMDAALRPNQILAVGGLPLAILDGPRAKQVVDLVEQKLWTPLGLRSLSPDDTAYRPHYQGGVWERDSAYHQGTAWPWLVGPFVEAWLRVHGNTPENRQAARVRFVQPLAAHLDDAGLGHIAEIADGDPPHTPRGCPFQAWSLGELLRLENAVLREQTAPLDHLASLNSPALVGANR